MIFCSISKSYKKNYIEGSGAFDFYYVSRVFCGWDYGITNKKAAKLKSMSIYHELQVMLLPINTVGKRSLCRLSFMYMSLAHLTVQI